MARRALEALGWPELEIERMDLETCFAHGPDKTFPPPGWTWRDVRRPWSVLGAEFLADLDDEDECCWAEVEWGSP